MNYLVHLITFKQAFASKMDTGVWDHGTSYHMPSMITTAKPQHRKLKVVLKPTKLEFMLLRPRLEWV